MDPTSTKTPARNKLIYFTFSLLVTVAVFTYLFTQVTLTEVLDLIRQADLRGVLMFLVLSFSMSVFRTMRYGLVLQTAGYRPAALPLFLVVLVRNFFSDLLPARIGSLVYIYLVTTRLRIPFGAAASSFALTFLFDFIALAPLIALAAFFVGASSGLSPGVLVAGGLVLLVGTVIALALLSQLVHLAWWMVGCLRFLSPARRASWQGALLDAGRDIERAREAGIYTRLTVLSLLVRLGKYGSLYVFLFALASPLGYSFAELHPPKVFLGLCASELAASLPISGIAGFGVYEGAWALTFRLLGFSGEFADLTAVSHHLFTQVYGYSLGALALLLLLLPVFKYNKIPQTTGTSKRGPIRFYLVLILISSVIAGLLVLAYNVPSSIGAHPP